MNHFSRREVLTSLASATLALDPHVRRFRQARQPYAMVLGTAQDGGLPQVGCYTPRCEAARADPRFVASLALVHPDSDRYYLVDATPDLTRQVDLITESGFRARAQARRPFDGIFLTHAHIGHYLGLALLGREGLGTTRTPVYCTAQMADFLTNNGPWSLMVDEGRIFFPSVPGYTGIFIHKGTSSAWSRGCIVIAEQEMLRIWNAITPKDGRNITVIVNG